MNLCALNSTNLYLLPKIVIKQILNKSAEHKNIIINNIDTTSSLKLSGIKDKYIQNKWKLLKDFKYQRDRE